MLIQNKLNLIVAFIVLLILKLMCTFIPILLSILILKIKKVIKFRCIFIQSVNKVCAVTSGYDLVSFRFGSGCRHFV